MLGGEERREGGGKVVAGGLRCLERRAVAQGGKVVWSI